MPLTPEQRIQIGTHITPKLAEQGCPACGQTREDRWMPADDIGAIGNLNVPIVVLTCQECGHMELFNAWHTQVVTL